MNQKPYSLGDNPPTIENALETDQLNRSGFAQQVVDSLLASINKDGGVVVSVEGIWGSGKTHALRMIEQLFSKAPNKPIVVHFNPWLVGDRDALLKQFFSAALSAIQKIDPSKRLEAVGDAFKVFSYALPTATAVATLFFDFPWVTSCLVWLAKKTEGLGKIGTYFENRANRRSADLNKAKATVEQALRDYTKPIVIFIDDIDRLTAAEVYEVIRIVKAVGDLPNLGFVLAWDSDYVCEALNKHGIPRAPQYLDKIVQLRMQLPSPSRNSMTDLVEAQLGSLQWDKYAHLSSGGTDGRVPQLWQQALRPVITTPRDLARVFTHVRTVEGSLRGQILLTDIIAMSAIAVLEPGLFNAIKKWPELFAGRAQGDYLNRLEFQSNEANATARGFLEKLDYRRDFDSVLLFLFPGLRYQEPSSNGAKSLSPNRGRNTPGAIANRDRLDTYLQQLLNDDAPDLAMVSKFVLEPDARQDIASHIKSTSSENFLNALANATVDLPKLSIDESFTLIVEVAALLDLPSFVEQARRSMLGSLDLYVENLMLFQSRMFEGKGYLEESVRRIIESKNALAFSQRLLHALVFPQDFGNRLFVQMDSTKIDVEKLKATFKEMFVTAIENGLVFHLGCRNRLFWLVSSVFKSECPGLYSKIASDPDKLDLFALCFVEGSFSTLGPQYELSQERITALQAFTSLEQLRTVADSRLQQDLSEDCRVAWSVIKDGKTRIASSGQIVDH